MKKLLLILLFPFAAFGQVTSWDTVQEGYYKVVVGEDTLEANFNRYDTALKVAYDSASSGKEIRILQPDFRFEYELADIPVEQLLLEAHQTPDSATTVEYDSTGFVKTFTFHTDSTKKKDDMSLITTDLSFHFTAKQGVTESGGDVSQWDSQVGSYNLSIAAGQGGPRIGDVQLNSNDVITFDGTDDLLELNSSSVERRPSASGFSMTYLYVRVPASNGFRYIIDGQNTNFRMSVNTQDTNIIRGRSGPSSNSVQSGYTTDTWMVVTVRWARDDLGSGDDIISKLYIDGTEVDTNTFITSNSTGLVMGGHADASGLAPFDIAEMAEYHDIASPHSQSEIDQMVTYFEDEWAASETTLTPDSLSHNHTLEAPVFESIYALVPNGLQHGHSLESPTFLSNYTLSANGLQHNHTLESPTFLSSYSLTPNGLQHGHSLGSPSFLSAYTLAANSLQHSHSLESPAFTSLYTLAAGNLQHGHSLESPTTIPAYTFSPNGLSHNHSIASTTLNAFYELLANGLQHGHSLDSPTTTPGYLASPESLQHRHTLQATSISEAILLVPNDLSHGHTLDASGVDVSYLLSANGLQHTHNLSGSTVAVAYGLSANSLQHGHSLGIPTFEVAYLIAPNDLQHAHSLEQAGLIPHYVFSPADLQHNHVLEQAVLSVVGKATMMELSADELYAVSLQDKRLYKITLAVEEENQNTAADELYNISLQAKKQYIITLNANEVIK